MSQADRTKRRHHRETESVSEDGEESDERTLCFMPSEGINVEVLVFYLRNYLGGDSDAESGVHPKHQNQTGYFIRSRLGLSTAMMRDLKQDSRDWQTERRTRRGRVNYSESATASRRLELGASGQPAIFAETKELANSKSTSPAGKLETSSSFLPSPPPQYPETTKSLLPESAPQYSGTIRAERDKSGSRHQSSRASQISSPFGNISRLVPVATYAAETSQQLRDLKLVKYVASKNAASSPDEFPSLPTMEADTISVPSDIDGKHLPNPFIQAGKLHDLPILFGTKIQKRFNAIPDTGATLNVVNYRFLKDMSTDDISNMLTATQEEAESDILEIANGNTFSTMGQVTLSCAFLDTPGAVMAVAFHVCKSLSEHVQVVFGRPFLDTTRVLTAFSHRLVERPMAFDRILRVMRMRIGESAVGFNMRILMGSTLILACPDTGSEIDLISKDFVNQIYAPSLELERTDPQRIQLANGEPQRLLGKVVVKISIPKRRKKKVEDSLKASVLLMELTESDEDNEEDELDDRPRTNNSVSTLGLSQERAFYVVDHLQCNVILGQAFLHSVDAFGTQRHAILRSDSAQSQSTLNGIFVLSDAQNTWVEFWSKYTKREESESRLPTTEAELHRALNELDQCWIRSKRQREKCISDAKRRLHDAVIEVEISQYASHVIELEKEHASATVEYHADVQKVREAFEEASAAKLAQNLPRTTTAPKKPRKLWSSLLGLG